jgi:hypothetical protein
MGLEKAPVVKQTNPFSQPSVHKIYATKLTTSGEPLKAGVGGGNCELDGENEFKVQCSRFNVLIAFEP